MLKPGEVMETDRLLLRRYQKKDLKDLYAYLSDPEVLQFEPYLPMDWNETEKELDRRIASEEMIAVELKADGTMIGNIYVGSRDFHALEIGYVFHKAYWGRGYAAEGCRKVIAAAFSNGVHRIYAECDPQNPASWRLLEALEFEREAHLRENVYFRNDAEGHPIWKDTYIYAKRNP